MSDPNSQPQNNEEILSGHVRSHSRPPSMPSDNSNKDSEARLQEDLFHHQQQQHHQRDVSNLTLAGAARISNGVTPTSYLENSYHNSQKTNIQRSKSLTRPERRRPRQGILSGTVHQQQKALMSSTIPHTTHHRPHNQPMPNNLQEQLEKLKQAQFAPAETVQSKVSDSEEESSVLTSWWAWLAFLCTCCFPPYIIRVFFGKTNKNMQQAWREKVTLCYLIGFLCGLMTYIIYGLNVDLCPHDRTTYPYSRANTSVPEVIERTEVYVFGQVFPFEIMWDYFANYDLKLTSDFSGLEIGSIFDGDVDNSCAPFKVGDHDPTLPNCLITGKTGQTLRPPNGGCFSLADLLKFYNNNIYLSFEWYDIRPNLDILGDTVLNVTRYFEYNNSSQLLFGPEVDLAIRQNRGNDLTYALLYTPEGKKARHCLLARYGIGITSQDVGGCIADQIMMTVMFTVIICIIATRYVMSCLFHWVISRRLTKPGGRSNWLAWRLKRGGNDDPSKHIPGPYKNYPRIASPNTLISCSTNSIQSHQQASTPSSELVLSGNNTDIVDTQLYTVMLVTCYSEGEEGLKTTMDSLSNTTYSNKRKIFFVIADGLITGAGETKTTPEIAVGMMDLTPAMENPKPCSYLAVADGEKQLNMAKVYAGHYNGTPCITIVKCGTEEEQAGAKAGNRGKRDSQVILMAFFQRVLFNDRLCELDYEIFWKMTWLMKGVTPDNFELVLTVDADTMVLPDALSYMVAAMANDITIMGLCGETRIANKATSWVTAIQVFEYYISHHYSKAFESLFGMVTCLPGCFSMYRIKSPKNGSWVPILANPDIILEYNQNIVTTLHEKNLLLLGEDRFLSTLMLRNFPKRQMIFLPQARCRTVVPDSFSVLLSQRRRWINSTVHNLMELVFVSDLCGIACFSMQFFVFTDLIGTFMLPAAVAMGIYLIVSTALSSNTQWQSLGLMIGVLILPALLIVITTFKFIYIGWMIIYICALPIWNMVLPLYSFWHFDDFTWGATRVVVGEKKGDVHGDTEGKFDSSKLTMKKWEDWEAERTGQGQKQVRKFPLKTPQEKMSAFDGKSRSKLF